MKPEYQAWIDRHIPDPLAAGGRCVEMTLLMVRAFPELTRVRGHYGQWEHWWCKTADDEIVDPTACQFPIGYRYAEFHGPDPIGRCPNCGELIWEEKDGDTMFCDNVCATAYARYVTGGL